MNVVDLAKVRKEREPHLHGGAFCMRCDHEWEAVIPHTGGHDQIGMNANPIECPACHCISGRLKFDFAPSEGVHVWTCKCENQLFYFHPDGIYCPRCGTQQTFPK